MTIDIINVIIIIIIIIMFCLRYQVTFVRYKLLSFALIMKDLQNMFSMVWSAQWQSEQAWHRTTHDSILLHVGVGLDWVSNNNTAAVVKIQWNLGKNISCSFHKVLL